LELKICGDFFGDGLLSPDLAEVAPIAIGAPFDNGLLLGFN
jgi:hypothetical protein